MADSIGSSPDTSGALAVGSSYTSTLDFPGDTDWFSIALIAGTTYVFDLAGGTLEDPLLELLAASGAVIDADDDSGAGRNASIVFTAASSGIYYLAARASGNNGTGTYALSAQLPPMLSVADTTVAETDAGSTAADFTVSLSSALSRDVTFTYYTSNDLALAGADYLAVTGQVIIPSGSTSATFSVASRAIWI
jgi:hypothetical protein